VESLSSNSPRLYPIDPGDSKQKETISLREGERRSALYWAAFLLALVVYWMTAVMDDPYDHGEHILQAWQWLHGSLNVDGYSIHETALFQGHRYILHPPLAAVVDLPYVAIFGPARQIVVSILVGAFCVALVWKLTKSWWLTCFFAFGTVFFYEVTLGAPWGFVLVLSCAPTLLALNELEGKCRPLWIGVWAGVAALARYDLVAVFPVYLLLFAGRKQPPSHHTPGGILKMLPGFVFAGVVYVLYARLRYGTFTDISLWLWYQQEESGAAAHPGLGPFSIHYLPMNIFTALFLAPNYSPVFPWVRPTIAGQSLLLTSPGFLLAFRAPWRERETWLLWLAVVLSLGGCMFVYSNGVQQLGCRYWIIATPFLILLMRRGWENDQLSKVLLIASILLVASGLATIRLIGWG